MIRWVPALILGILLVGCGEDSGPVDSGPDNATTRYTGGMAVVAPAYEPFSHEYTITDDDGLTASEIIIDVEGGDLDIQRTQDNATSANIMDLYTPSLPSDDCKLSI